MLAWRPMGIVGVVAGLCALLMAAFILRSAPGRTANRRLAYVLVLEAVAVGAGMGLQFFFDTDASSYAMKAAASMAVLALGGGYLAFVATLDSPLVAPLRGQAAGWALLALSGAAPLVFLLRPEMFYEGTLATAVNPREGLAGPWQLRLFQVVGLIALFAFVAALSAWRRAPPGSVARQRAASFALAFGARDVLWGLCFFLVYPLKMAHPGSIWAAAWYAATPLITLLFIGLMGYGILRTQLFDIELKVKAGIRRSTLAAAFVVVFLVVSQLIQEVATTTLGVVAGAVATGLLLFALSPLQRMAERVSDAAMPRATGSDEYLAYRKLQVYRATVEEAAADGSIHERERRLLLRLRQELSIRPEDAAAVESDVMRQLAA